MDIDLEDTKTSRKHISIMVYEDEEISLRDLASTNGTLVNGERVLQSELKDGDKITLGGTMLKVCVQKMDEDKR